MGLYDREYGTDWTTLERDEATERAYALGVAESLGQYNRDEFEALHDEMDSSYDESMIELAFREGKTEGKEIQQSTDDEGDVVWAALVGDEKTTVDESELPTGGRDGVPAAVDKADALNKPNPNEVDATDKPDFLDK
jgi:hypothetical protein